MKYIDESDAIELLWFMIVALSAHFLYYRCLDMSVIMIVFVVVFFIIIICSKESINELMKIVVKYTTGWVF